MASNHISKPKKHFFQSHYQTLLSHLNINKRWEKKSNTSWNILGQNQLLRQSGFRAVEWVSSYTAKVPQALVITIKGVIVALP
jgi:hypothetical protein